MPRPWHIVSDERLGELATNRQLFKLLGINGWVPQELTQSLAPMVGFRNILVHGYKEVDKAIVRDVVENRLDDLLAYVQAVRSKMLP